MSTAEMGTTDLIGLTDFDEWRTHASRAFASLSSDTLETGRDFSGDLTVRTFGAAQVARISASPHVVWRSSKDIRSGHQPEVKVSFVVAGSAILEQGRLRSVLEKGSAALYHVDSEYELAMPSFCDQIVLKVDRNLLSELVAVPDGDGLAFTNDNLFIDCLAILTKGLMESPLDPPETPLLMTSSDSLLLGQKILDFLALAISRHTETPVASGPSRRELFLRAVEYITKNLSDSTLNPPTVAAAIGVSERSLYAIFNDEDTRVTEFIIQERLNRAYNELAGQGGRSITAVAMGWGFKSSSHFSRRFQTQFGITPSDIRSRHRDRTTTSRSE